jgi:SAM-dependent methyltransferase
VFGGGPLGRALYRRAPAIELHSLQPLQLQRESRVLDVGCGAGALVFALGELGLRQACGIDAFVPADIVYDNGVTVKRQDIFQTQGSWDAIMFHHSFEHLADPAATLARVAQLLVPGGQCLLRVPTVTSYAWQHYGVHWVQLDAPRHLHLFSHESMRRLALAAGFELERIVHDATAFQFWGSEQYRAGVPLHDEGSYARNPGAGLFSAAQIAEFERRSVVLNAQQQGDQAAFYLRRQG